MINETLPGIAETQNILIWKRPTRITDWIQPKSPHRTSPKFKPSVWEHCPNAAQCSDHCCGEHVPVPSSPLEKSFYFKGLSKSLTCETENLMKVTQIQILFQEGFMTSIDRNFSVIKINNSRPEECCFINKNYLSLYMLSG